MLYWMYVVFICIYTKKTGQFLHKHKFFTFIKKTSHCFYIMREYHPVEKQNYWCPSMTASMCCIKDAVICRVTQSTGVKPPFSSLTHMSPYSVTKCNFLDSEPSYPMHVSSTVTSKVIVSGLHTCRVLINRYCPVQTHGREGIGTLDDERFLLLQMWTAHLLDIYCTHQSKWLSSALHWFFYWLVLVPNLRHIQWGCDVVTVTAIVKGGYLIII